MIKIISFEERETNWSVTGYQVAHFFDCIHTIYQFIKSFLDNKMSILEEDGAFKNACIISFSWALHILPKRISIWAC